MSGRSLLSAHVGLKLYGFFYHLSQQSIKKILYFHQHQHSTVKKDNVKIKETKNEKKQKRKNNK